MLFTYTDLVVFNKPPNYWIDGDHEQNNGISTLKQYIEQNEAFKHLFEDSQEEILLKQRKQVIAKRRIFFPHQVSTLLKSLFPSSFFSLFFPITYFVTLQLDYATSGNCHY